MRILDHIHPVIYVGTQRAGAVAATYSNVQIPMFFSQGHGYRLEEASSIEHRISCQLGNHTACGKVGRATVALIDVETKYLPPGIAHEKHINSAIAIHIQGRQTGRYAVAHISDVQVGIVIRSTPQHLAA